MLFLTYQYESNQLFRLLAVRKSNANQIGFWGKEFQVEAKYSIVKNENLILHYISTFKYK